MNEIKKYLDTVCEQVRFQKAHDILKKELQDHITDQTDTFIKQGLEEEIAVQKAIAEMGDPVLVGTELDRVHRPKCEWSFIVFVCLLTLAHFAMQYLFFKDVFYTAPLLQNSIILLIDIGIMILFYHIDFTILANHGKLFYSIYVVLLLFCNGYTWLSGCFLSMDLTEAHATVLGGFTDVYYVLFGVINLPILLYFFPVILSGLLYSYRGKGYKKIFWCCFSVLPVLFCCYANLLKIPSIVLSVVGFALILITIFKNWFAVKKKYAVLLVFAMIVFTIVFMKWLSIMDYSYISNIYYEHMEKIQVMLQRNIKGSSILGEGKDVFIQNNTGLLIDGFDFLKQWAEYFPAYLLHYGGWIVVLPLIAIYFFIMIRGFLLIKKQKSQLGWLTATAIMLTFFIISMWNIVANSGLFVAINPLGIPFFSTSDSVNIVFFSLMGILLSVFRTGHITTDKHVTIHKKTKKKLVTISENHIHICIPIPFSKKKMKKISQNH